MYIISTYTESMHFIELNTLVNIKISITDYDNYHQNCSYNI